MSAPRFRVGTSRQLCRHVAERWHDQYGDNPYNPHHAEIQGQLTALRKKGTKAEVDAIIGNPTWTTQMCDACERSVELWVVFAESDIESGTKVCLECLEDAVVEAENAR